VVVVVPICCSGRKEQRLEGVSREVPKFGGSSFRVGRKRNPWVHGYVSDFAAAAAILCFGAPREIGIQF